MQFLFAISWYYSSLLAEKIFLNPFVLHESIHLEKVEKTTSANFCFYLSYKLKANFISWAFKVSTNVKVTHSEVK